MPEHTYTPGDLVLCASLAPPRIGIVLARPPSAPADDPRYLIGFADTDALYAYLPGEVLEPAATPSAREVRAALADRFDPHIRDERSRWLCGGLGVEDILEAISIDELAAERAPEKGECPFCGEIGSFFTSEKWGTYHCFACGEGGDAIDFVIKVEGVSHDEALLHLIVRATWGSCDHPWLVEPPSLYEQAVLLCKVHDRVSVSLIQQVLKIGYDRAAKIIDEALGSGDLP